MYTMYIRVSDHLLGIYAVVVQRAFGNCIFVYAQRQSSLGIHRYRKYQKYVCHSVRFQVCCVRHVDTRDRATQIRSFGVHQADLILLLHHRAAYDPFDKTWCDLVEPG